MSKRSFLVIICILFLVLNLNGLSKKQKQQIQAVNDVALVSVTGMKVFDVNKFLSVLPEQNHFAFMTLDVDSLDRSSIVNQVKDEIFNTYASQLAFNLLPEADVLSDDLTAVSPPDFKANKALYVADGYPAVSTMSGKKIHEGTLKVLDNADSTMFVYYNFVLELLKVAELNIRKEKTIGSLTVGCNMMIMVKNKNNKGKLDTPIRIASYVTSDRHLQYTYPVVFELPDLLPVCESAASLALEDAMGKLIKMLNEAK